MNSLITKQIYTNPIPSQPIPFVKPLSYEFRVVEHIDSNGKVERVALQVEVWEHDEFGVGNVKIYWSDVPRVKMHNGTLVI